MKQIILFCLSKGIVTPRSPLLPATEITLLYFMGHLSKTVSYATVKTYMPSISYLHVIFQIPFNMGHMQLPEKCLKGLKRLKGEKLRDRRPITVTTTRARVFTYARHCDKDPGSGWSRDSFKNLLLCVVGKVSNYMLPHTSDTFQMQGARCNVAKNNMNFLI